MIIIEKWIGRLGNNITELRHMIHIALYYDAKIELPDHSFFDIKIIKKRFNNNKNELELKNLYSFFHKNRIKNITNEVFNTNHTEVITPVYKKMGH